MTKNATTIAPNFLGQLSKIYVIERLGIKPEHHQLTADGAWISLAARLVKTDELLRSIGADPRGIERGLRN